MRRLSIFPFPPATLRLPFVQRLTARVRIACPNGRPRHEGDEGAVTLLARCCSRTVVSTESITDMGPLSCGQWWIPHRVHRSHSMTAAYFHHETERPGIMRQDTARRDDNTIEGPPSLGPTRLGQPTGFLGASLASAMWAQTSDSASKFHGMSGFRGV